MKIIKNPIFLGLYAYTATILVQYGFNSYFGLPSNLIEPSIRDNIILFFSLLKGFIGMLAALPILGWLTLLSPLFILIALMFFFHIHDFVVKIAIALILVYSLFVFYNLGESLAKTTKEFNVISGECITQKENIVYIVPAFYQTSALVVPVKSDSRIIAGSFFIKEPLGVECEVKKETIGQIYKQ